MRWPFGRRRHADFYEDAANRLTRAREARDELGDATENLPPGLADLPGMRWNRGWVLLLIFLVLVVVVFGYRTAHSRPPKLAPNCAKTVLALSTTSGQQGRPVTWSATGPVARYVLTVDAPQITARGTVPAGARGAVAGHPFTMSRCHGSGQFALSLPVGSHEVRLYRLAPGGGQVVARKKITVE